MSKQLQDIITPFHLLSHLEQQEIVERCRYTKYILRPTIQKKAAYKAKKKSTANKKKKTNAKLVALLKAMPKAQRDAVLKAHKDKDQDKKGNK